MTTFCWLPPESVPTATSGSRALVFMPSVRRRTASRISLPLTRQRVPTAPTFTWAVFHRTDCSSIRPCRLRSAGTRLMPRRAACVAERTGPPPSG